jgi:glycosyltransferase involved in cell wall biosynthesis
MKKNLLFIGPYPPPYGGIASHLNDMFLMLEKDKYKIFSITRSNKDKILKTSRMTNVFFSSRRYLKNNIFTIIPILFKRFKVRKDLKWREYFRAIVYYSYVKEFINSNEIDDVFVYSIDNAFIIPLLKKNVPSTISINLMIFGAFYLNPEKYIKRSSYVKEIFRNCDIITSSSQYCGGSIAQVLGHNFPVKTIYVGVNNEIYSPKHNKTIHTELDLPSTAIVLLFMGRMDQSMGVDFLLKNAIKILNINPNLYLIMSGAKGKLSSKVNELAQKQPRIRYCENISFDKKPDYYSSCDLFLAPTMEKHACMGVSIKEAMSMGKAVIASDSGGIPEAVVNGENGFLVGFRDGDLDQNEFIQKVSLLVNDEPLRKIMGAKGHEKAVSIFSNSRTYQHYLEIIEK